MRKQMIESAALDVAAQIRSVEESIEAALVEIADLQTKMVHARGITNAGFAETHAAFEELASTNSGLIAARGGIANCHAALSESRKTIPGLRTVSWGDGEKCPDVKTAQLRVVA